MRWIVGAYYRLFCKIRHRAFLKRVRKAIATFLVKESRLPKVQASLPLGPTASPRESEDEEADAAIEAGSHDNVSAVVVQLERTQGDGGDALKVPRSFDEKRKQSSFHATPV